MNKQETVAYQRQYYQDNKDRIRIRKRGWSRAWRKKNPNAVSEANRKYREKCKRRKEEGK